MDRRCEEQASEARRAVEDTLSTGGAIAMSHDFETTEPAPADATVPRPIVIVQYRKKGILSRLALPTVILIAACAVLSHRYRIGDWRGLAALIGRTEMVRKPSAPEPSATADAASIPVSRPLVIRQVPETPPQPVPQSPPRLLASAFLRPSPLAIALPEPETASDLTDRAIEGIRLEAAQRLAELAEKDQIEDQKARQFAQDQKDAVARNNEREAKLRSQADESRNAFRDELQRILRKAGQRTAAREIVALCEHEGVSLGADLRRIHRDLPDGYTAVGRRSRIQNAANRG